MGAGWYLLFGFMVAGLAAYAIKDTEDLGDPAVIISLLILIVAWPLGLAMLLLMVAKEQLYESKAASNSKKKTKKEKK